MLLEGGDCCKISEHFLTALNLAGSVAGTFVRALAPEPDPTEVCGDVLQRMEPKFAGPISANFGPK